MPLDGTSAKQDIDNNLGNKGYRGIRIANIIPALKNLVDWVVTSINNNLTTWLKTADGQPGGANTDSVYRIGKTVFGRNNSNGTVAALEATTGWIDNLNGNQVSPYFAITNSADGLAPTRYFAIGELPAGSGGTFDFAQIEFVGKPWDNGSGSPIELSIYLANRGGLRYQYTSRGDANSTGIICQQMPDGRTVIYMAANNDFKVISARFVNFAQAIIYGTPSYSSNLLGIEVFNSMKPSQYRPIQALRYRFPSFTLSNTDGGFPPAPIAEAGSAQLSLGANWVGGSSELALINSNTSGGGFSFWQQTGTTAKRMLAFLNSIGNLILGGRLIFQANTANRKVVLYDTNDNDHQFYGLGVDPGGLRYQVELSSARHTWYAGATALTSTELMRLQGDGKLLMGYTNANDRDLLQINGSVSAKFNKQGGNPSAGETPVDSWRVIKNTGNGEVRLWVNDNGTMKSVLLS